MICIIFRLSFITFAMIINEMMMISVMANGLNIRFHILEGLNDTSFSPFLYVWNTCINRNRGTAGRPQRTKNEYIFHLSGMQCVRITIKIQSPFKISMKGSWPCVLKQILCLSSQDKLCADTLFDVSALGWCLCIVNCFVRSLIFSVRADFSRRTNNVKHKEAWTLLSSHWGPENCPLKTDKSRQRYRAGVCLTYSCS